MRSTEDRQDILNKEQLEAVTTTEGYVRVIAGAGSGKTRALTHRFAFLVNELGVLPENILCVTFTNKAANEMRQRIHNLIGDRDTGYINTFHGFCVSVLQEDSYAVSYPRSFLVLDNSDIDSMLRIIYEERGLTLRDKTFADARDMIEIQKLFRKPDYYLDMIDMSPEVLHDKYMQARSTDDIIFYGYLYQEKKCFGLDYNDLIKFTLYIFRENASIRQKWQERLAYIMIDEFQDIDGLQYELMEALCGYHHNLFIVGDPDQTIYTWRGANVRYLLEFDEKHPGTRTVMMLKNYRSTPQILRAANSLIAKNEHRIAKDLVPVLGDGRPVVYSSCGNTEAEAGWVAAEAEKLHGEGVPYKDMTILYRAHYVTRPVEEALLKAKLPYRIYSGVPFFGRAEIKDALSYLRMILLQDDLSFRRIANNPKRNLGRRRMEFLEHYAEEHGCSLYTALKETLEDGIFKGTGAARFVRLIDRFSTSFEGQPVSEVLAAVLHESGYEEMLRTEGSQERLDNLAELRQSVYDYEVSCGEEHALQHYLSHVALFTNTDMEETSDRIRLMTVHAAKGLEFPYVFLCGMNEGVFPSRRTRDLPGMEEERRLAFVAMTRAEKGLFLSGAEGRNLDGTPRYPSRFVLDIDSGLLEYVRKPTEQLIADTREYVTRWQRFAGAGGAVGPGWDKAAGAGGAWAEAEAEAAALAEGTRVTHAYLGEGTVLSYDPARRACTVRFDSLPTPRVLAAGVLTKL